MIAPMDDPYLTENVAEPLFRGFFMLGRRHEEERGKSTKPGQGSPKVGPSLSSPHAQPRVSSLTRKEFWALSIQTWLAAILIFLLIGGGLILFFWLWLY